MNKPEQAIVELRAGMQKGGWWNLNSISQYPNFVPLRETEAFQQIIRACEERLREEAPHGTRKLLVKGNKNADIALFLLHWRGANIQDFSQYWEADNLHMGFLHSSQVHAYNMFNWDNKDIAVHDAKEGFREFQSQYTENQLQSIIGGSSQGAGVAMELLLAGGFPEAKGFFVVVPAVKDLSLFEELLRKKQYGDIKGYMLIGEKDSFADGPRKLYKLFQQYKFPCKLVEVKEMGHYFPEKFAKYLQEGMRYIKG
jgi:predicted esterase